LGEEMKNNRTYSFAMFLIGTILLAACGQAVAPTANASVPAVATSAPVAQASPIPTDTKSAPVSTANCSVVSKDEVGKILGEPVVEVRDPAKNGSLCVYQTQNLILELNTQTRFGGFGDSVNFMKQIRANDLDGGDTPLEVSGLGDEAFYHGGSGLLRSLLVRKGDTVYSFGLRKITADNSLSSPDNAEKLEKSLAELELSRLP
jgi:hypothetical protein